MKAINAFTITKLLHLA